MLWILFGILVVLALVWGLASISQSYVVAQQAQAAIEASRAAQIASLGNLVVIGVLALLVLILLVCLYFVLKSKTKSAWTPGPNANWSRTIAEPLHQILQQQPSVQLPAANPNLLSDELLNDLWMS